MKFKASIANLLLLICAGGCLFMGCVNQGSVSSTGGVTWDDRMGSALMFIGLGIGLWALITYLKGKSLGSSIAGESKRKTAGVIFIWALCFLVFGGAWYLWG